MIPNQDEDQTNKKEFPKVNIELDNEQPEALEIAIDNEDKNPLNSNQELQSISRSHLSDDGYETRLKKGRKPSYDKFHVKDSCFKKYRKTFFHRKFKKNQNEVFSGITVALAQIPEAVAFSIIANVSPIVGLNAAFIMGFITSIIGGRPGMISGATGAISVVQGPLVIDEGEEVLFAAMIACGLIQILIGLLRGGKLIKLVSEPVMIGFLNGLALVIGIAQITSFRTVCGKSDPNKCSFIEGSELWYMIIMSIVSMICIMVLPLIPKIGKYLPSALIVLAICTIINYFGLETKTVGDIESVSGDFPKIHLPDVEGFDFEKFLLIFRKGLEYGLIGLIESLMTVQIIDEFTKTKGSLTMESIAQGVGNFLCGFTKSLGGCAMIGQSQINVHSGGIKRLSGIAASLGVLLIILVASPIIEVMPVAALTGLMFVVVIKTFYWKTFLLLTRMPIFNIFIVILVTVVTVIFDLAIAVIIGIVLSALKFTWDKGKFIRNKTKFDVHPNPKRKVYCFKGDLMFSSVNFFTKRFRYILDPDDVSLDCSHLNIWDFTAVESLLKVYKLYQDCNKKFRIINLDRRSFKMIKKTKLLKSDVFTRQNSKSDKILENVN